MYCSNCKHKNKTHAKFCSECGKSLSDNLVNEKSVVIRQAKTIVFGTIGIGLICGVIALGIPPKEMDKLNNENYEDEITMAEEMELGSLAEIQQQSTDENGVDEIQLSENATPIKDMQANAGGDSTESVQSAQDVYEAFRLSYQEALNTQNFSHVELYFKDGTSVKSIYSDFVSQVPVGDYYNFLTHTTELEHIDENIVLLTANEIFELESDGTAAEIKERTRKYTFERQDDTYVIIQIENIEVIGAASTAKSDKTEYLEFIQYVIDSHTEAYESGSTTGEMKELLWESYDMWDYELNRIYGLLKEKLSTSDMEALRVKQRAWIKERDELTSNPEEIGYLTRVEILNDLTSERTLELINMYFEY